MSLPRDIRVYEWPDGVFVELILGRTNFGGMLQIKSPLPDGRSTPLFTMEVRAGGGGPPLVIAFRFEGNPQPVIPPTYLPKLLGFLLDLGVSYPTDAPQRSLIQRGDQRTDYALYPRFVSDIRWEGRYEEAERFVLKRIDGEWKTAEDIKTRRYLDLLKNFQIHPPGFRISDKWDVTYSMAATWPMESLYFHALVDKVLDEELILPESSRTAWEAANVERGSFLIPSPEEIELFRLLDERLPLLLPVKQLEEWLQERT